MLKSKTGIVQENQILVANKLAPVTNPKGTYYFPFPLQPGSKQPTPEICCQSELFNTSQIQQSDVPYLIILGVQKASTTFLSSALAHARDWQKPKCSIIDYSQPVKEYHFFDSPKVDTEAAQLYFDGWKANNRNVSASVYFEATPNYSIMSYAPCRIKALMKNPKLVLSIRDPTERLISLYKMMVQFKDIRPFNTNTTFAEKTQHNINWLRRTGCSFDGSSGSVKGWRDCFQCRYAVREGIKPRQACFYQYKQDEELDQSMWEQMDNMAVARGMYAPQVAWLFEFFTTDQVMIFNMDEIQSDVSDVANRIAKFLGVEPKFRLSELKGLKGQEFFATANGTARYHSNKYPVGYEKEFSELAQIARKFYRPHNKQLYSLFYDLNVPFQPFKSDTDWVPRLYKKLHKRN